MHEHVRPVRAGIVVLESSDGGRVRGRRPPHRTSRVRPGERRCSLIATINATAEERAELRNVIGPRLVKARKQAGLGQQELATILGMETSAQLNGWEQGRRHMPIDKLILVADALNCSTDYLLARSDDCTRDHAEGLRHAVLRGVRSQLVRTAEIVTDQIARHTRLVGSDAATVDDLLAAADKLLDSQATWQRLNLEAFEVQRGSASIVAACEALEKAVVDVRRKARVSRALDGDLRRALAELPQADPSLLGNDDTE
ncbi:MAG: XRE family transcriptional regulator [Comamonadaceae bacterium]|nr:MAG: XRE family transcriptional regulator [Comamonadaceae bacterium]